MSLKTLSGLPQDDPTEKAKQMEFFFLLTGIGVLPPIKMVEFLHDDCGFAEDDAIAAVEDVVGFKITNDSYERTGGSDG